ncbi:hypothetical protein RB201_38460 [Streptomyces sp. S1A(2023)]
MNSTRAFARRMLVTTSLRPFRHQPPSTDAAFISVPDMSLPWASSWYAAAILPLPRRMSATRRDCSSSAEVQTLTEEISELAP